MPATPKHTQCVAANQAQGVLHQPQAVPAIGLPRLRKELVTGVTVHGRHKWMGHDSYTLPQLNEIVWTLLSLFKTSIGQFAHMQHPLALYRYV